MDHAPPTDSDPQPAPETTPPTLADHVRQVLHSAAAPMTFADVKKALKAAGVKFTGKGKVADADIEREIGEELQLGRVFRHPSGKGGAERLWHRDEKTFHREAALAAAATAQPLAKLTAALAKGVKGTDVGFVEQIVRGLIGEAKLREHPPKLKAGGPLFGAERPTPPPPPPAWYETKAYKKPFADLLKAARKVVGAGATTAAEVLDELKRQLEPEAEAFELSGTNGGEPLATHAPLTHDQIAELEAKILQAVSHQKPVPIMSLSDLRGHLPEAYRGAEFDAAVLRLAKAHRLRLQQDAVPVERTGEQKRQYVTDEAGRLFTSASV